MRNPGMSAGAAEKDNTNMCCNNLSSPRSLHSTRHKSCSRHFLALLISSNELDHDMLSILTA